MGRETGGNRRPMARRNAAARRARRERLELAGAWAFAVAAVGLLGGLWVAALFNPGWWL